MQEEEKNAVTPTEAAETPEHSLQIALSCNILIFRFFRLFFLPHIRFAPIAAES